MRTLEMLGPAVGKSGTYLEPVEKRRRENGGRRGKTRRGDGCRNNGGQGHGDVSRPGGGSGRPEAEVTGTLQTQAWRRASGRLGAVGVQV